MEATLINHTLSRSLSFWIRTTWEEGVQKEWGRIKDWEKAIGVSTIILDMYKAVKN